jgi:hypothetical protein
MWFTLQFFCAILHTGEDPRVAGLDSFRSRKFDLGVSQSDQRSYILFFHFLNNS